MKKKGTFRTVFSFVGEYRSKMVLSVICAIISVLGGFVPFLGVYQIIQLFYFGQAATLPVLTWAGICAGGYVIKILFYGISTTLSHRSAYGILENIRLAITDKLMRAPLGTVLNTTSGKMKNIIVDRVETIELPLAHMIPEGISNLLLPMIVFIYLATIDWRMALAAMGTLPLGAIVYAVMMKNYNERYAKFMEASNYVNSVIVEYVEGIEVVKAFNQSASSYEKFSKAVVGFKDYTLDWFRAAWKFMTLGGAILPSSLLFVVPVGILLYSQGVLTPAELTISAIMSMSIVVPVLWFTVAVNDYKSIQYAVNDAQTLLDLPELADASKPAEITDFDVQFEKVRFSYGQDEKEVLCGIDLHIPQGSYYALVGPSGGGKSTIARLVARFWDVEAGSISIGGKNIKEIPFSQLNRLVSFVTQDNFLFNCSLFENIRMGRPEATDEEVLRAAQAAQCGELIQKLEKGWDTPAGEAGKKLSGGERQRIAIARAILKDAPIIILDEATSFTDPENEDKIQNSLAKLTQGKTLLVIAHRLSTIKNADQILLLEKGCITASGTHSEMLLENKQYRDLWEAHIGSKNWAAGERRIREVAANV